MDLYLPERPRVLYVGDSSTIDGGLSTWLKDICEVEVLSVPRTETPNFESRLSDAQLILLDASVSRSEELCRYFAQSPATQHLRLVALGRLSQADNEAEFLENGAADFISMPVDHKSFIARIKAHLSHQFNVDIVRKIKSHYEREAQRRVEEVQATQTVLIYSLTALAETRDNSTGYHIQRTQSYVQALARHLSHDPRFEKILTLDYIDLLYRSAPLHDIGKVGIPDKILLKPGRLDPDEFEVMKMHPLLGKQALENAERRLGRQVEFLSVAKEIAYCHHEKWDGSGYPQGLKGEAIPLSARLMALADVYDAVISRRVYKDEMAHDQAIDIIIQGRGTHFDPDIVDAFAEIEGEFLRISQDLADGESQSDHGTQAEAKAAARSNAGTVEPQGDQLLSELQARVDSIPDDVRPFVVSLLTTTSIVPKLLANVILSMLAKKRGALLGPVHLALAQMYRAQQREGRDAEEVRGASLSLIHACHGSKAANAALRFLLDLPSLLPSDRKSTHALK